MWRDSLIRQLIDSLTRSTAGHPGSPARRKGDHQSWSCRTVEHDRVEIADQRPPAPIVTMMATAYPPDSPRYVAGICADTGVFAHNLAALALPASAATSVPLNGGQEPAGGEAGVTASSAIRSTAPNSAGGCPGRALPTRSPATSTSPRAGLQDRSSSTSTPMAWWARTHPAAARSPRGWLRPSPPTPEPITSTCTTLASRPAPSGVSSSSRPGLHLATGVDHAALGRDGRPDAIRIGGAWY